MKKKIIGLLSLFVMPALASAQGFDPSGGEFGDLLADILIFINNIVIPFIIGIGFLAFVWGMFKFFILGGADEEKKEQGKSLMVWATVGFVLIIIFFGVINLLTESTGLSGDTIRNVPRVDVP
jgi:heme/copper-type cytochrome/quinol oxidase subunit 2